MKHQYGDTLAARQSEIKEEEQEETHTPLSKNRHKDISAHCVKAALGNLPLHGVLSFTEYAPFQAVADTFRDEFMTYASSNIADRLLGTGAQSGIALPLWYFPDVFLASPVLYAYKTKEDDHPAYGAPLSEDDQKKRGLFHPALQHICGLFPNQQWRDIVQIFNRVCRNMQGYDGKKISSELVNRMECAAQICDDLYVATPYHDVVIRDMEGARTGLFPRTKNPYLIGMIRRLPFVLVMGRLNSGPIFSEYPAMLAETIEFLRAHTHTFKALKGSVKKMTDISDKGFLIDWLREGYAKK